jgi:heme/copper-type cytochrome/quinol oxidase subunit 2
MPILRYFNMFILSGVGLVLASVAGFATQNKFLTEPGQKTNPQASLIYLAAGVLMLINGWVSIRMAQSAPRAREDERKSETEAQQETNLLDTL